MSFMMIFPSRIERIFFSSSEICLETPLLRPHDPLGGPDHPQVGKPCYKLSVFNTGMEYVISTNSEYRKQVCQQGRSIKLILVQVYWGFFNVNLTEFTYLFHRENKSREAIFGSVGPVRRTGFHSFFRRLRHI